MKTVRIRRFSSVLFSAMRRPEKKGSPPPLSECLRTGFRPCRIRRRDADEKTTPAKNETKASHRLRRNVLLGKKPAYAPYPAFFAENEPLLRESEPTDIDAFCPTKRAVTTRNRPAACRVSFRTCAVLRRPHALPPPSRHVPDRTNRSGEPLILCPRSFRHPSHKPLRSRRQVASRPSLTSAQLRTASVPRRTTPPKMPKISLFRKYLPCETVVKTSTGSSRLSATGSPFASRPSTSPLTAVLLPASPFSGTLLRQIATLTPRQLEHLRNRPVHDIVPEFAPRGTAAITIPVRQTMPRLEMPKIFRARLQIDRRTDALVEQAPQRTLGRAIRIPSMKKINIADFEPNLSDERRRTAERNIGERRLSTDSMFTFSHTGTLFDSCSKICAEPGSSSILPNRSDKTCRGPRIVGPRLFILSLLHLGNSE